MAIVWACALSVDEYVAAGRAVAIPRPDCPACSMAMAFWSGYQRSVRRRGPALKLWVRRARCRRCRASHALVPSFCLVGRLDAVEEIGAVLTAVVGEARGVRPVAEEADVPHTTARDWVRRFCRRAALIGAAFAAVVVEVAGIAPSVPARRSVGEHALGAIGHAFAAVAARAGPALASLWGFVAIVTGGGLLATNTNPLSIVLGRRRLIVPVPDAD
jgi:transposase-like protein